jgi:tRNA A58 N-methylase Trm61
LDKYVTSTHRDVLSNGFLLDDKVTANSVDAVFLDLPRPEEAVKHAYEVLKTKGKLCNFSPCIEQVQKATQEMAKLGFYDIRTFETLNREHELGTFSYKSIHTVDDEIEEPEKNEKSYAKKGKNNSKNQDANKRKAKMLNKSIHPVAT